MPVRLLLSRQTVLFYLIACCILLPGYCFAQAKLGSAVRLKNVLIKPAANVALWADSIRTMKEAGYAQVLLQFSSLPTPAQKELLAQNNIRLLQHVPDNAFTAIVKLPFTGSLAGLPITAVVNIADEWKADKNVWDKVNANLNTAVAVMVSFDTQVPQQEIKEFLKKAGAIVEKSELENFGIYKVIIAAKSVKPLAHHYSVQYISPVAKYINADVEAKAMSRVNIVGQPVNMGGYGLLGDGVTIGVGDDVSGIYHVDMQDRVINYNPAAITHHGEFTNGIIGSAGIVDPLSEGVAPHVTLLDHLYDVVLQETPLMRQRYNMSVTNNSYVTIEGDCNYSGTYDVYAQFIDQLAVQYPSVFHVFASGNDGLLNCTPYPNGFSTVAGGYQTGKNELVVTSTDKEYNKASDASSGPVRDGRLKPEITAVGYNDYSCIDVTGYEYASGTSFASPQVAGVAALLTELYKAIHGGALPNSDVLKTLLMVGATDIGNIGPDYTFGYGFLNAQHSVQVLDSNHYFTNSIANNGLQNITINVPPNTGRLKIMLYWNDEAASPLAATQLVNDLDLLVQSPDGATHKPLVLDPTPANVNNVAVEGEDHLNNNEEVIINNPQAGSYVINITGYHVPAATQGYVVAYDLEPAGIKIANPIAGTKVPAGRLYHVYWDAPDVTNTFTLQYSTNNGATWLPIASNINAAQRIYDWTPDSTLSSGTCQLKLTRDNTTDVSITPTFIVSQQPVVQLDADQCPGYINIHWAAIANATGYQVLRKVGPYMQVIDTVAATNYSFSVPVYDSTYYVAVSPIVNGLAGYRSIAVWRRPVDGTCVGFPAGDIGVTATTLTNGRQLTSSQLTNTQLMTVTLRNRYIAAATNYSLAYSVNGGIWSRLFGPPTIPADTAINVALPGLPLGAAGTYTIKVAVHNIGTADPVTQNDTLTTQVTNISNPVINLATPFTDGFETMPAFSLSHDSIGISPNGHWDYANSTDTGRLRTFVDSSITLTGNRSVSLDAYLTLPGNQNYFNGTFNLSNYDSATDELRMEFDYMLHGMPKTADGNQVWVRGTDIKAWVNIFNYDVNSYPGTLLHSGSLSLTDIMLRNRQNFSTSTQVRFGQNDTSLIAAPSYGNGVTLDNFTIYAVQHDVQLVSIANPQTVNCGLGNTAPLTVQVYNGVRQTQTNVQLFYRLDGGTLNKDTLASIPGKDTVLFTFTQSMNLAATGKHTLDVYLSNTGDTYRGNDSILSYTFYNQPLIASFPYLEDFEAGPGNWFTQGLNDSWQYGTPASPKIHKAASGTKAWKTNLTGTYNNLETSYLYSPCFDVSQLASPMLSFSTAMDIENCGSTLCDAGYIEYSYDGVVWTKLGASGQGYSWYDNTFDVWNSEGNTRWHVASIPLPASTQPVRLRFVLNADPGATFEGIAVDDIHIFDKAYGVFGGQTPVHISAQPTGGAWQPVINNNNIAASVNANGQTPGTLDVGVYNNYHYTNADKTQYIFPRDFTVQAKQKSNDSLGVRLFIEDAEMIELLQDTVCASCSRPADVYAMGISKYDNVANPALENGTLDDNVGGTYTYYPYTAIKWVPYDVGYYAELNVKSFSEFWFSDGGPSHQFSIADDYLVFDAEKLTPQQVKVSWLSYIDTLVSTYTVQRSMDGSTFANIYTTTALHQPAPQYVYNDTPTVSIGSSVYYRLLYYFNTGDSLYAPTRRVDWTDVNELINVYPNPTRGQINIQWTANPGATLQVELLDETGRTATRQTTTATQWNNLTTLQTPRFSSGVYFLKILLDGKKYVKKIVYE